MVISLDFKQWRERYEWPLGSGRRLSEERILCIERLVKENISVRGHLRPKQVLLYIVEWKTSKSSTYVRLVSSLSDQVVKDTLKALQKTLNDAPNDVCSAISPLSMLGNKSETLGPRIASAILRFLDPITHSYGIIDRYVAEFTNDQGITNFMMTSGGFVAHHEQNILEFEKYHKWLQEKSVELDKTSYVSIYNEPKKFCPVDVEMAIFSYKTQSIKREGC